MPNLLAHHLLVKRFALKEAELRSAYPGAEDFITGNFDYLALGAQGPDPLFYLGIVPGHALHLVAASKKIGNALHKEDGKRFFRLLVERSYVIEPEGNTNRQQRQFKAFVLGQFSHYLLDRECHPYILYESGFDKETGKIKGHSHYDHAHFESEIDFALCQKYHYDYFLSHPADILPDNKLVLKLIDDNLNQPLCQMYGLKHLPKRFYSNALTNMRSMISYLNKGSDFRVALFPKSISVKGMRLPKEVNEDVLNEKREFWLDPVTGERHAESFLELHSRAFQILEEVYEEILKNGFNYESFAKYINGLNYYGTPLDAKWTYQRRYKD